MESVCLWDGKEISTNISRCIDHSMQKDSNLRMSLTLAVTWRKTAASGETTALDGSTVNDDFGLPWKKNLNRLWEFLIHLYPGKSTRLTGAGINQRPNSIINWLYPVSIQSCFDVNLTSITFEKRWNDVRVTSYANRVPL